MDEQCAEVLDCLMSSEYEIQQVATASLPVAKKKLIEIESDLREALRIVSELISFCDKESSE